jgi:hypothetical protein
MPELTPEELKREQERLRLIQEQNEAAKELLSTYEKQKKVTGTLTKDEKDILNLTKDLGKLSAELESSIQKRLNTNSSSKELAEQLKKLEQERVNFEDNAVKLSQAKLQSQQKFQQLDNDRITKANSLNSIQETLKIELEEQRKKEGELIELSKSRKKVDQDKAKQLMAEIALGKNILAEVKEIEEKEKEKLKIAQAAADEQYNLVKQLDKTIEANEEIKKQQEKEVALLKEAVAQKRKQEVLNTLQEQFNIKQIKDVFTLTGAIKAFADGIKNANENSVWISKNLGYGAVEADIMTDKMQLMSLTSDETNVTLKSARESMAQLASATGGVAEFSDDALKTQIMLTKQLGLSGEEAAGIYKMGVLNNQTSEATNKQMIQAFASTRNAVKGSANFKETMAAASKVSGQLASNLKNNPAAITAAVVKMQALGTTLEQAKKQGDSLLSWESSIENELKAELLTGKQLNLERARAAALAGDQVTLAEELNKNVGSLTDFNNMNVLQQKALAEAVGLTTDELADQLRKQEIATEQGKSLAQVNAEELEAAEKRKTIQEKFNNITEKLMDVIGSLGTLLAPFIGGITWLLDHTWVVYTILGLWAAKSLLIGNNFKGIAGTVKGIATSLGKKVFGLGGGKTEAPKVETPTPEAGGKKGGGMLSSLKGISTTDMIKGAAAILILSAALWVAAKAFQEFATVKWEDVAKGIVGIGALAGIAFLLSKASGDMIQGAIAVAILGAALIPFAFAMSLIADLKMENIIAAAAGLLIFAAAAAGLGFILSFILLGAIGIAALGASLVVFGLGLQVVSEGGKGLTQLFNDLSQLDADKLDKISPSLKSIGQAILYLGAGGVMSAIGKLLGGDSPAQIIKDIAESANGITQAATGLQLMAVALQQVSSALATIDTSKLEALSEFSDKQSGGTIGRAISGITDFITSPIKAVGEAMGGGEAKTSGGTDLTPLIAAINEVKTSVDKLYNKNTTINMDGSKVGTTLTQGSYKVA